MRRSFGPAVAAAALLLALVPARAAPDLGPWFSRATAYGQDLRAQATTPDFMPGTTFSSLCAVAKMRGPRIGNGIWELMRYDHRHNIGLAAAATDQCSAALFRATPPAVATTDADLSQYHTGRGIRIGSTYASVLAAYGGHSVRRGTRFVAAYTTSILDHDITPAHKPVKLPEDITFVIDGDRVSSIMISVDLGGLY